MLLDWNKGEIKYHTEPPKSTAQIEIVQHHSVEFDWAAPVRVEQPGDLAAFFGRDSLSGALQRRGGWWPAIICRLRRSRATAVRVRAAAGVWRGPS